jgi:hypothetical protein
MSSEAHRGAQLELDFALDFRGGTASASEPVFCLTEKSPKLSSDSANKRSLSSLAAMVVPR